MVGMRKVNVNRETQAYLFGGLLTVLVCSGYFKIDTSTCVQAFLVYCGALFGKGVAFDHYNAKEHEAEKKNNNDTQG